MERIDNLSLECNNKDHQITMINFGKVSIEAEKDRLSKEIEDLTAFYNREK
jgi:hypothetical protein